MDRSLKVRHTSLALNFKIKAEMEERVGIGQGRVTDNLQQDIKLLDGAIHIPDAKTIRMIYHLLDKDGIYVGASTALNVVAAKELAVKLGKGSRVATILCDGAYR